MGLVFTLILLYNKYVYSASVFRFIYAGTEEINTDKHIISVT